MIPLKLELKNFLSYGQTVQVIDFSNHDLICFSGKNGNGKSALLDALTWALWGQARKISGTIKADAGLLRLGQTQMMVCLEFLCNKQHYRVRREFAKTYGKPYVALDVELFDDKKQKFLSLTDKTIRKTQEKIERIVGLDFNTFVNSAFLRQGLSDEFSQKSSKERKNILASILGLSLYDQLQKRALEHMRSNEQEKKFLLKLQESVYLEIAKEKDLKEQFVASKKEIKSLEKKFALLDKDSEKHERERMDLSKEKQQLELIEKELNNAKQNINKKQNGLRQYIASWKSVHSKILNVPAVAVLEKKRIKLFEQDTNFRTAQQKYLLLQGDILKKQEVLQKKVHEVSVKSERVIQEELLKVEKLSLASKQQNGIVEQKEKQLKELQEKEKKTKCNCVNLKKELQQYDLFKKEFLQIKDQFEKRRIFYQNMVHRGNWLKAEMKDLENKKTTMHAQTSPSCPLCEQVLTIKRKQFLAKQFIKQECFCNHRLNRVTGVLKKLKKILLEQHEQIKKVTFQNERFQQMDLQLKAHEKTLQEISKEINKNSIELSVLNVQTKDLLQAVEKQQKILDQKKQSSDKNILKNADVVALKKQVDDLQKEQTKVEYDKKQHEEVQKELFEIDKKIKECDSLKQEQSEQKSRQLQIASLCAELKELKKVQKDCEKKLKVLPEFQNKLSANEVLVKELKFSIKQIQQEKEKAAQNKGKIESELQRIEKIKKETKDRKDKLKNVSEQIDLYQELYKTFGKNGIQALLIEEAIPEIEDEANKLLSQLTDNQSQIFIESLRDLKSGGVRETLDIHISDSVGVRPYEMFSGGEAFRIDFSLRIAISKLLARRAGATLQTLIIDEGFGSQDEEGLQRLMDALYVIKNDFAKVIVVSHLPALKESFPVHFIVDKISTGSIVRVEQRG
jgi:DNA repair protein SbcC/Rad50